MDNELKEILENILNKIEKIDKRLEVVEYKVDRNTEKIDDVSLDLKISERNIRKDIRQLKDSEDTVVEVLKQHELLSR
jgi:hypothetical protein